MLRRKHTSKEKNKKCTRMHSFFPPRRTSAKHKRTATSRRNVLFSSHPPHPLLSPRVGRALSGRAAVLRNKLSIKVLLSKGKSRVAVACLRRSHEKLECKKETPITAVCSAEALKVPLPFRFVLRKSKKSVFQQPPRRPGRGGVRTVLCVRGD